MRFTASFCKLQKTKNFGSLSISSFFCCGKDLGQKKFYNASTFCFGTRKRKKYLNIYFYSAKKKKTFENLFHFEILPNRKVK